MKEIYINGDIYTSSTTDADSFIVENGRFVYVGDTETSLNLSEDKDKIIDLKKAFVTAGFNDSHMHVLNYGYSLTMVNLSKHTTSLKEVKEALKSFIALEEIDKDRWILGRGWNHDYFEDEKRFPTRYDLDCVSTEYPICITRACGHVSVVNSKALEIMGVNNKTPQVDGGRFDVDPSGEPLGIFRENALSFIFDKIPTPSKEEIKAMILRACKNLNAYGVTSAQTDDFSALPGIDYEIILKAYKELEEERKLTVKIYEQTLFNNLRDIKNYLEKGYNTGIGTDYFRLGPLKLLGDGSLGARTAYLSEPYSDDSSTRGISAFNKEDLGLIISYAHNSNMQIAVHCIGDGIMTEVMEAYERALKDKPRENHRHGIVHCQIANEELLSKFKELNLHGYIQSIFLDYDINIIEKRVGKERAKTSYNFKTIMNNSSISNGSDCPVELPNVLKGIQCAVTRKTLNGEKGPYLIEEALSMEEAIKSYTIFGAYSSFEEKIKGSIEKDKVADFVIMDKSLFKVPESEIKEIQILETYVDGKCVYKHKSAK